MIPKFRVWDNTRNKIVDTENLLNIDFDYNIIVYQEISLIYTGVSKCYHEISFEDVTVMQSTGLTDKKGKDIFDGDIIRVGNGKSIDSIAVVDFVNGGFFADYHDPIIQPNLLYFIPEKIEVIGNIYQDKHLLRGKKYFD